VFNGPLGIPLVFATALGMLATAVLSLLLDGVLWRPLRARRAGFMSLFLASIGLALVLRQSLLLAYGPQPQTYRVDLFKVHLLGSVRLSQAQFITIVTAAVVIVVISLFLARTTFGRTMRALADDRALAAIAGIDVGRVIALTWILSGLLAGIAGVLKVGGSANPEMVKAMREWIGNDEVGIVVGAVTVVHEDGDAARELARNEVGMYLDVIGRLDPTISGEPRLEQFALAGTPEAVAAHADALYAAGAKRVEFGTPQGRTTREGVDLLCEEVLPLLRR
jgi:hypothetical protein